MLNSLKKCAAGAAVGIANVIPGVSGGTVAVMLNVYPEIISLAAFDLKKIRENPKDFLFLTAGSGIGLLLFARFFKKLHAAFPIQTNYFFIGLILGSVFIIVSFLKEEPPAKKGAFFFKTGCFLAGLTLMLALYFVKTLFNFKQTAVMDVLSVKDGALLFFSGVAGASAMVIPGISGSFILLIIGVYGTVIQAVTDFNVKVLAFTGAGAVLGIAASGRVIARLLTRYPQKLYAFILGLVLGSLPYLYPKICQPFKMRVVSAVCMLAGYTLISVFERKKYEKKAL